MVICSVITCSSSSSSVTCAISWFTLTGSLEHSLILVDVPYWGNIPIHMILTFITRLKVHTKYSGTV